MSFWKRQFPIVIVFVSGVLLVAQYYVPNRASEQLLQESNRWVRIIQNCALLLGVVSLIGNHWRKISRRQAGYGYSALVFVSFIAMVYFGLRFGIDAPREKHVPVTIPAATSEAGGAFNTKVPVEKGFGVRIEPAGGQELPKAVLTVVDETGEPKPLSPTQPVWFPDEGTTLTLAVPAGAGAGPVVVGLYLKERISPGNWMFDTFKVSMESTMYSMLAFFIASAAFRAFRARSVDASIMLIAAVVMMIGRVSFGEMISKWFSETWLFFPEATKWLQDVPVNAAKRAIFLGIALSVIALSIRVIFGIERSYLGRGE